MRRLHQAVSTKVFFCFFFCFFFFFFFFFFFCFFFFFFDFFFFLFLFFCVFFSIFFNLFMVQPLLSSNSRAAKPRIQKRLHISRLFFTLKPLGLLWPELFCCEKQCRKSYQGSGSISWWGNNLNKYGLHLLKANHLLFSTACVEQVKHTKLILSRGKTLSI